LYIVLTKVFYGRYDNSKGTMPFSRTSIGVNLTRQQIIAEADWIFLHWIWGNFLSLYGIKKILNKGKRIIIVCHDNAHFTGGCHVRMGCEKYMHGCGKCPQLNSDDEHDISYKQLRRKIKTYEGANVIVVSPSKWMDDNVARSLVFKNKPHFVIPNPIDTDFFVPKKKITERGTKKILFGAVNATTTVYKGYRELIEAMNILCDKYQDIGDIEAYVFGSSGENVECEKLFPITYLGYLNQKEMVDAYNSVDVYVVPSLEDSFNNTVAESLSCETPVVAFATGGIVDIIDHKENGYLAEYRSVEDLAKGINWVLQNNPNNILGKNGRNKMIGYCSYKTVAERYMNILQT